MSKDFWIPVSDKPIDVNAGEVLAFHPDWVCPDFNPKGVRIGFITDDGAFISSKWVDAHDDYISHTGIMPTHYILIPHHP